MLKSVSFLYYLIKKGLRMYKITVRYNIRNSKHHFGPPGLLVTFQSALKHVKDLSLRLRSYTCLRADWSVTKRPEGPQWCLLFLK